MGFTADGRDQVAFGDPGADGDTTTRADDDISDPGTLAASLALTDGTVLELNGALYAHLVDYDIVFDDDVALTADLFLQTGGYEVGSLMGLAPSADPTSLMGSFGQVEAPTADDAAGIAALYGPAVRFVCTPQTGDRIVGGLPLTVSCSVVSSFRDAMTAATWSWGDGAESTGLDATHAYSTAGSYAISLSVDGGDDGCGPTGWSATATSDSGFVTACGPPLPAFEAVYEDSLAWRMRNETDLSPYGCLSDAEWDVYEGDVGGRRLGDLTFDGWEPVIHLPGPGQYTVVLNLTGPGGTSAAKLAIGEAAGCDSAPARPDAAALLAAMASVVAVRRGQRVRFGRPSREERASARASRRE